jgi:hypothetical protein
MPNWVFNTMSVTGPKPDVDAFREKAARPYRTFHRGEFTNSGYDQDVIVERESTGAIQFWNFLEPSDKDAYFGHEQKPEGYESMTLDERMAEAMQFKGDHWYDWNVRNWGTKWDTNDPYELGYADGFVSYSFSTAWSPAEGAFRAMVEQHPSLTFSFECIEEQGWGVIFAGENGELRELRSWDIPESHSDWIESGQDCGRCTHGYDDDLYEDCPDPRVGAAN